MKIWCESCIGEGSVHQLDDDGNPYYGECESCDGKGYTENTELERLAEIGRATEKMYSNSGFMIFDVLGEYGDVQSYNCNDTIDDLLDWAKED